MEATGRLLDSRDYEEISLAEIALEAGVSHGTLYARFRTKRVLLHELHVRYCDRVREEIGEAMARLDAGGGDPAVRLEEGVGLFVSHVLANRRRLRNFWRAGAADLSFRSRQRALDREQLSRVVTCVQRHLPGAGGAMGGNAGRMAVALVRDIVDTAAPLGGDRDVEARQLTRQVTEMLLALVAENRRAET